MAKPSILEISKRGDEYLFILTPAGKPLSGAAERACPVRVHSETVATFCRDIKKSVDAANKNPFKPGINSEPFIVAGRGLFRTLLPDKDPLIHEMLGILRRLRTPLLISTDDSSVFWELLFDEGRKEFLGLHFSMSRRLRMRGLPSAPPRRREDWRWLVIANPNRNERDRSLPQTVKEAERLRDWLGDRKVQHLDYLEGAEATFDAVLGALAQNEYDVIHYAGHTDQDRKTGEYCLRLSRGQLFPASSISKMVRGNPIVFLNGCSTGTAKGLENSPGSAEGLTDAFLAAGAQLVIGSLFEAPDAGARAFAEKFYEAVLAGKSVGEAVRGARLHVKTKPEYGPTWACFVMYGDPCLRFNLREDTLQVLLQTVNSTRADFEPSCLRVLEQAVEYGAGQEVVGTPHLFAAMVDGEDRRVRDSLRLQGVPPDKLRKAFAEMFKDLAPSRKPSGSSLSENVGDILKHAQGVAETRSGARISESDLIEGFVQKHGGAAGKVLQKLGVNVASFLFEGEGDARRGTPEVVPSPRTRSSGRSSVSKAEAAGSPASRQRNKPVGSRVTEGSGRLSGIEPRAASPGLQAPFGSLDRLHFSVTSPPSILPGSSVVIDVWAHLAEQRQEILERAREEAMGAVVQIKSKGPIRVERGTILSVRLQVQDLVVDPPEDMILWDGEIGNATFALTAPKTAVGGSKRGTATIRVCGLEIARLSFIVQAGQRGTSCEVLPSLEQRHRTAFASYAREDRDAVLGRIQGLQKGVPTLDVFLDVAKLRSGEHWQERLRQEIVRRDVLYLFWSQAASTSKWVDWEWRCALHEKGVESIDPFPLAPPDKIRPPKELAGKLHFNDWVLAYMSSAGSATAPPQPEPEAALPLDRSAFSSDAWSALVRAAGLAQTSGSGLLGTPHLFWSMLQDQGSALAKALKRLGLGFAKEELGISGNDPAPVPLPKPRLSKSVSDLVTLAREAARVGGRSQVGGQDLLEGFVRQGGGTVGDVLRKKGLMLEALLSGLIQDGGVLDLTRVSREVRKLIAAAQTFGRRNGIIGRPHLLCAMLSTEKSLLADLLRRQGMDPARLADLLHAGLTGESTRETEVPPRTPVMSSGLVLILCSVEASGPKSGSAAVNEARLLAPFLEGMSRDLKRFLIREGVRWDDLINEARRRAQPEQTSRPRTTHDEP